MHRESATTGRNTQGEPSPQHVDQEAQEACEDTASAVVHSTCNRPAPAAEAALRCNTDLAARQILETRTISDHRHRKAPKPWKRTASTRMPLVPCILQQSASLDCGDGAPRSKSTAQELPILPSHRDILEVPRLERMATTTGSLGPIHLATGQTKKSDGDIQGIP